MERQSIDELTKNVPQQKLNQPCADEHLLETALFISNWRPIAPFLGLRETRVRSIVCENPEDLLAQTIAMLRKWREQCGRKATYRKLAKVFWKLQRSDLVAKLAELLTSESESSNSGSEEEGDAKLNSCSMYLKDLYLSRLPVATVSFLPLPKSKYTKLAMIVTEEESNFPEEELVALKHRGKVKKIREKKIPVELKDVFTLCKSEVRKVVLVEGVAGVGKSSMVINACREWGMGNIFNEFKRVVLVELRDPNVQAAKTLADILPARNREMAEEMEALIRAVDGEATLIIFDGWDEFPAHLRQKSLVQRIIENPGSLSLHKSAVMITSRPECSADLHHLASSRIEILGFSEDAVREYFADSLGGKSEKVTSYFEEHPHIADSCYVPLNAALILHLFLSFSQALPSTLHGVFCALVLCCIIREVKKNDPKRILPHLSTFNDLPLDLLQQLKNLCYLAYYGTKNGKILFSTQDLLDCGIDVNQFCTTFGLLQTSESFVACQKQYTCNFLHLSVQELLTAFHISQLPVEGASDDCQVSAVKALLEEKQEQVVIFYSGFTHLVHEAVNNLIGFGPLYLSCCFEAQNPTSCKRIRTNSETVLIIFYTLQQCLAFDYVLKHNILPRFRFDLYISRYTDRFLPILTRSLSHGPANGISLILRNLNAASSCTCISDVLKTSQTLSMIRIFDSVLAVEGLQCIALALQSNTSLSRLLFNLVKFTEGQSCDSVQIALTKALHLNTTLCTLHFTRCYSCDIAQVLSEGLNLNRGLKEIFLIDCNITAHGVTMLAKALEHHHTLNTLNISSNPIGNAGATAIADMLSVNDSLQELNVSNCNIGNVGLEAIVDAMVINKATSRLSKLGTNGNPITHNGWITLCRLIPLNFNVQPMKHRRHSYTAV